MNKLIEISKIIVVPSKYYKKVILDIYIVEEKKIFILQEIYTEQI